MKNRGYCYGIAIALLTLFGAALFMPAGAGAAADAPKRELWACYDVGSSGYIQASSIADAMLKKYKISVRLTPSGTAVGRLMPLVNKKVDIGFLASEVYCAVEGTYEFASIEWGPQDLRVILAHPSSHAIAATRDSGMKKIEDVKGKRWAVFPSASDEIKRNGYLAYLNFTEKDIQIIKFPGYKESTAALREGKADVAGIITTAAHAYELESHPKGIQFLEFDPKNKEGIARMQKVAPMMTIGYETVGAGLSKEKGVWTPFYRYPIITVRADMDADKVYGIIKRMDETFDLYKNAYPPNELWAIDKAGVPPADAPFHEGAIRYLREKGVWKPEYDKWNDAAIAHSKNVKAVWEEFMDSIEKMSEEEKKTVTGKKFSEHWLKFKEKGLQKLAK